MSTQRAQRRLSTTSFQGAGLNIERVRTEPCTIAGLHDVVPANELPAFVGRALATVAGEVAGQGRDIIGPPVCLFHSAPTDRVEVTAGYPVSRAMPAHADVVPAVLPGGLAVETVHTGPYERLDETYQKLAAWISEHGLSPSAQMWEQYVVGPGTEPDPARWRTRIVWPVG